MKPEREPVFSRPQPCAFLKTIARSLPGRRCLLALVGKKQVVFNDQLSPQKSPGPYLCFSYTRAQHSPGSSTIKLTSTLAESGAYSPNRAHHGTLARAAAPYLRITASRMAPNWSSEGAHLEKTILSHPNLRRVSTDQLNRNDSQLVASLEGDSSRTPTGKTFPDSYT